MGIFQVFVMLCIVVESWAFLGHQPLQLHLGTSRIGKSLNQAQLRIALHGPANRLIGSHVTQIRAIAEGGLRSTATATKDQFKKLLVATPSLVTLVSLNVGTTRLFKRFGLAVFPPPLVGMFALFFFLLALKDSDAANVVAFLKPGVDLVTRFLPMFFVPALVVLPLSASSIAAADAGRALGVVLGGLVISYGSTAAVVTALQQLDGNRVEVKDTSAPLPAFSSFLQRLLAAGTLLVGVAAAAAAAPTAPAALAAQAGALRFGFFAGATGFGFVAGSRLPARLPAAVNRVWHPLMSATAVISALFWAFGAATGAPFQSLLRAYLVPGGGAWSGAGNLVMYWLGPAIWSFALGLYGRRRLLAANLLPILGGTAASAAGGIATMALLGRLLAPAVVLRMALLPRATAALAVVQAAMIGASASLVTANCVVTGMLGANFGKVIMGALGVKSPCARGVATGGAAFSLGTAALAKDDPEAFPYAALSMALMSTWATILFALPPVRSAALGAAGLAPRLDPPAAAAPAAAAGPAVVAVVAPAAKK